MNRVKLALCREAGLAAEHIAIGATALGRANHAQEAYYAQALFSLSIGFERSAKLAIAVDHALCNQGEFPSPTYFIRMGHDIEELLCEVEKIAVRRGLTGDDQRLPQGQISLGIVSVLTKFATNVTRYYNLEALTGNRRNPGELDPIQSWFEFVTIPILKKHLRKRDLERFRDGASIAEAVFSEEVRVLHHDESGKVIDSVSHASMHSALTDFSKPYSRMYSLRIARFLYHVFAELTAESYRLGIEEIPHLTEFYAVFCGRDADFRKRKTWTIHL